MLKKGRKGVIMASKFKQILRAGVDIRSEHVDFMFDVADGVDKPVGDILSMAIQIGCEVLQSHAHIGIDPTKACRVTISYQDDNGLKFGAFG